MFHRRENIRADVVSSLSKCSAIMYAKLIRKSYKLCVIAEEKLPYLQIS